MIRPSSKYVLVKEDEVGKTMKGLDLPTKQDSRPSTGVILSIARLDPQLVLSFGTRVWYRRFAGEPIESEGVTLLCVHVDDIIAYEEEEEK